MLDRGFLAGKAFYASLGHDDPSLEAYLEAVHEVFELMAEATATETIGARLRGPVAMTGFARLT